MVLSDVVGHRPYHRDEFDGERHEENHRRRPKSRLTHQCERNTEHAQPGEDANGEVPFSALSSPFRPTWVPICASSGRVSIAIRETPSIPTKSTPMRLSRIMGEVLRSVLHDRLSVCMMTVQSSKVHVVGAGGDALGCHFLRRSRAHRSVSWRAAVGPLPMGLGWSKGVARRSSWWTR